VLTATCGVSDPILMVPLYLDELFDRPTLAFTFVDLVVVVRTEQ